VSQGHLTNKVVQPVKIAHRVNTVRLLNNQRAKIVLPQISALRGQPAATILKQPAQQGRTAMVLRVAYLILHCRTGTVVAITVEN
jgi:hypothetical protein